MGLQEHITFVEGLTHKKFYSHSKVGVGVEKQIFNQQLKVVISEVKENTEVRKIIQNN